MKDIRIEGIELPKDYGIIDLRIQHNGVAYQLGRSLLGHVKQYKVTEYEHHEARTNADRVRQMSDEELLETIYRHMGNAAACPDCFYKNGKERLQMWLEMDNKED